VIGLLGIGASAIAGVLTSPLTDRIARRVGGNLLPLDQSSDGERSERRYDLCGPGLYGDVNADNFTGPGDEHANPNGGQGIDYQPPIVGASCALPSPCISILPRARRPRSSRTIPVALRFHGLISSPGVDFGAAGEGFTLVGSSQAGVTIALFFPVLQDVWVAGNTDNGDTQGFVYYGQPIRLLPCAPPLPQGQGFDCRVTRVS